MQVTIVPRNEILKWHLVDKNASVIAKIRWSLISQYLYVLKCVTYNVVVLDRILEESNVNAYRQVLQKYLFGSVIFSFLL